MSGAFASAGHSAATIAAAVAGRVVVGLYASARKKLEKRRFYLVGASSSCGRRSVIAAGGCSRGAVIEVYRDFLKSVNALILRGFCGCSDLFKVCRFHFDYIRAVYIPVWAGRVFLAGVVYGYIFAIPVNISFCRVLN